MVNFLHRVKTRRKRKLENAKKKLSDARKAFEIVRENQFLKDEIEKIKAEIKKLSEDFKYIYVLECVNYKSGRYAGRKNFHFHMFMTGGLSAKEIQQIWNHGGIKCDFFKPDQYGAEAAPAYMSKDSKGRKRFTYSRNLKQPKQSKPKDGHISARTVEKMATQRVEDAAYWLHRYRGYRFIRCYSRLNPYNGHWYVSVVMYRKSNNSEWLTKWSIDDWITSDYIEIRRQKNERKNC